MPTVADSIFSKNSNILKEDLGRMPIDLAPDYAPWFGDLGFETFGRSSRVLGRDLRFKQRYRGTLTGVIQSGINSNWVDLFGDKQTDYGNAPFRLHDITEVAPDPRDSANPRRYGLTMELYALEFTLPLTYGQMKLEVTPSNIDEEIMPVFEGFARHLGLHFVTGFFAKQELGYRLGSIGSSSGSTPWAVNTTDDTVTFYPMEKSTYRFAEGQPVDLYTVISAPTRVNESAGVRIRLFVSIVDDSENKVVLQADPNADTSGWAAQLVAAPATIAASSFVTPAKNRKSGSWSGQYSFWDFLKWGGATNADKRLLGSSAITTTSDDFIDVTIRTAFKSWHRDVNGSLTIREFVRDLDSADRGFRRRWPSAGIETAIGSEGLFQAFWELDASQERLMNNRPGSQSNYGLESGFQIQTPRGLKVRLYESCYLEDGTIVAMKMKDNFKVIAPPLAQGASTGPSNMQPEGPANALPLEFYAQALGFPTDKVPLFDGNGNMHKACHIPGFAAYQIFPENQVPGAVWERVQTSRVFSTV